MKRIVQRQGFESDQHELPEALHPVLRRVYSARNVTTGIELDNSLTRLYSPADLKGISTAVDLLSGALLRQEKILVVGDFDADGATSSALMVSALRAMGAHSVDYLVPNRFEFGYGLTPEIVAVAAKSNPDLIITVDNGISSLDGVQAAREHGIRVLVTDHHLPGSELPGYLSQ
jgi:single-stranded-DNA-specific exonuclease